MLIACFVHERRHKMIMRYYEDVMNDVNFERLVIHDVATYIALHTSHWGHRPKNSNKQLS